MNQLAREIGITIENENTPEFLESIQKMIHTKFVNKIKKLNQESGPVILGEINNIKPSFLACLDMNENTKE